MAKIILIAPGVNGEDVGEAWIGFQWAHRLGKRHDVTLLTYHKRGLKPAAQQLSGIEVVEWMEPPLFGKAERLNSMMKPAYIPFYFRARNWIRNALASGRRFDLAHQPLPEGIRYPSPAANLGIPLLMGPVGGGLSSPPGFQAEEASSPWYVRLRAIDGFRRRWDPTLRATYRNADCVLGIADYVRDQVMEIPVRRFEVMSDTGLDQVPPPTDRSGHTGTIRLLYVGRLVRTKGVRDAIRAMAATRDLDTRLDILGEGPDRSECESLISTLGLGDRIKLHGWRSKAEVADFYKQADVFVFPSYREPGGNVVYEAMGYSLPLIVVDRGGPGSATSDLCAFKLPVTTPDALAADIAAAIRKLVEDPSLRLRMGEAAHVHVRQTALWSTKLERVDAIYADLIGRNRQRPSHDAEQETPRVAPA